ncbi:hypothetical protein ACHJH3_03215 [Campylobacter sp. MOP7]|uniref:hypothetical protein n=1 Tax=Campylobacter canis TaxID=3378588 RepID=UPI00387EBEDA
MIDYNRENKGFVCFVYNLQRTIIPWAILLAVVLGLFALSFSFANSLLLVQLRFALIFIAFGAIIAMINPKSFIVKLVAYAFIFLGVIFGLSYSNGAENFNIHELTVSFPFGLELHKILPAVFAPDNANFFGSSEARDTISLFGFGSFALIGAVFLVMILSWFVYNARSSEINPI